MRLGLGAFGLPISISVREPLPANAFYDLGEAGHVIHAELATVRVAEIEFDAVAVQVLARGVLVDAFHAALEDRVIAFNRVGVDPRRILANIFASAVIGRAVEGLQRARAFVLVGFVGQQIGFACNVFVEDALNFLSREFSQHEATRRASVAVDQRKDAVEIPSAGANVIAALAARVLRLQRLVGFNAAEVAAEDRAVVFHRFADAVREKPGALKRDAERAVKLVGADALLAGRNQEHGLKPDVQLDVAVFEDRADLHGEGLAALFDVALVDANPGALALQRAALIDHAAMGADTAIRPHAGFNPPVGRCFVAEMLGVENATHADKIDRLSGYVKYNIASWHVWNLTPRWLSAS